MPSEKNATRHLEVETALKRRGTKWRRVGVLFTVWLVFVWMAVFGELTWLSILGALIVGVAAQALFPLPHHEGIWQIRPILALYLAAHFIWDLARAGVHVAWLVISGRPHEDAILRCEIRSSNPVYLTILAAMTSLIPGTIVVQVDRSKKVIYLHCLDVEAQGGASGIRRATSNQEARILRAVAPTAVLTEVGLGRTAAKKSPSQEGTPDA